MKIFTLKDLLIKLLFWSSLLGLNIIWITSNNPPLISAITIVILLSFILTTLIDLSYFFFYRYLVYKHLKDLCDYKYSIGFFHWANWYTVKLVKSPYISLMMNYELFYIKIPIVTYEYLKLSRL